MFTTPKLLSLVLLVGSVVPGIAAERDGGRRIRLGGVSAGVSHVSGGRWYGPAGWYGPAMWGPALYGSMAYGPGLWRPWGPVWWDPFWWGGWMHPGYWSGFSQGPNMGEVKLQATPKDALVYVDGAFAGPATKLKNMWLEPGIYELEVRDDSGALWKKKVYVLSGKTLQLRPDLRASAEVDR